METKRYFILHCTKCQSVLELSSQKKGQWIKCSVCEGIIQVPVGGLHEYPTPKFSRQS